ncbi:MAG: DNA-directed RNA polymerase subunit omega [Clostridiales bacterium]|nr:DNA-directed RNA polymerase subunit omega [Clostridiales bacterium]
MIHPSYTELIDVLSEQESLESSMLSRYTIIIAAAKRARQIVDGSEILVEDPKVNKPVSIAVEELYNSKIKIISHNPDEEEAKAREQLAHQELSEISLDNYGNDD